MTPLVLLVCALSVCGSVSAGPSGPRPSSGREVNRQASYNASAYPLANGERLPFDLPPIPENAKDVHEVRIVEFIPKPASAAETNGTDQMAVDARIGPAGLLYYNSIL